VIVEHPVRGGYELRGAVRPVESTNAWQRFRLEVPSKETAVLVVEEARPLQSTYALTNLTSSQMVLFASQKSIDKDIETALRRILAQKDAVAALEAKKVALDEENQKIFDSQERLRENMKALKGSPEEKALLQRYTKQLNDQEDRLEALGKEIQQLESQQSAAQEQLDQAVLSLSFDVKL
jgi:chromosome segregation ATPase